jgi:hypothetical protein
MGLRHNRLVPRAFNRLGRRAGFAALALLFLGAQLADIAHRAEASHEICEVHGELVHGTSSVAPVSGAHLELDHASAPVRLIPSGNSTAESHEHCALGPMQRQLSQVLDLEPSIRVTPALVRCAEPEELERVVPRLGTGAESARAPPRRA